MRSFLEQVPAGILHGEDFLDDDGVTNKPVNIAVSDNESRARAPAQTLASSTSPALASGRGQYQRRGSHSYSACFYVFPLPAPEDVPATAGLMRPIRLIAPAAR